MAHIGIVGVSPEGAALFYRQVTRQASQRLPAAEQPRVSLHNEPLSLYIDAIRRDDWHTVGRLLRRSAELLARCGAEFCLTPDNAVQHAVQLAEVGSPIPWLTMTELVAQVVAADRRQLVGLIGTKLVMHSSTYQTPLGMRGVRIMHPDPEDAESLDKVIYGELIFGHIRPDSRQFLFDLLRKLKERGCEGVILGCSEAPLVISAENSPLPVYDPASILADAGLERVIRARPPAAAV